MKIEKKIQLKRLSYFQIIILISIFAYSFEQFTDYDFLKCDGANVKNNYGKGNYIYLRGTNIGNLFVQESWMSSTNAKDQKTILEDLTKRFSQDKALELLDYYESNYFTESDFDNCKNLGLSVIRVPFTYMNLYKKSGNEWKLRDDAFARLDWIVNESSKRGIYIILDLHGAFGSQNGQDHSGEVIEKASDVTFFSNESLMTKTLELWKEVANHYKGNPAIAAYDTLNEPGEKAGTTSSKHWKFYDRMYKTIRKEDPDHIIIMESCWGVSNLPKPSEYGWENVIYEYHHYPWDYVEDTEANFNGQKKAIDNLVKNVEKSDYGVPTYIGEFNCFDGSNSWNYVLEKMNKAGWHYSNWSYKARGMGSWGIYHEKGNQKVTPSSTSESDIKKIWGSTSIGTNTNDIGITYKNLKPKLPGTVVFADKDLTGDDYFSFKANINDKYVSADNYGESNLQANRDSYQEWEQFRVIYNSDGTVSFQARVNNKYLCAVFDDNDTKNPIIARSNKIGTWEKFYIEKNSDGSFSLRTFENNLYVQADIEDSTPGILHACGLSVGTWEKFSFESTNPSSIPHSSEVSLMTIEGEKPNFLDKFLIFASLTTKNKNNYKIIGYYPYWCRNNLSKIRWEKFTHIYYVLDGESLGKMDTLNKKNSVIKEIISSCNKYNITPVLSVNEGLYQKRRRFSEIFGKNLGRSSKYKLLANNIVNKAKDYGFKGIDIFWKIPRDSIGSQYREFMNYLGGLCHENNMIFTIDISPQNDLNIPNEILDLLDFINIIPNDRNDDDDKEELLLNKIENTLFNLKNLMKVPENKLIIGFSSYSTTKEENNYSFLIENSSFLKLNSKSDKTELMNKNPGGILLWEICKDNEEEEN